MNEILKTRSPIITILLF